MEEEKSAINVELLGQQFSFASDDDSTHLLEVIDYVRSRLNQVASVTHNVGPTKTALLATLNIANEFIQLQNQHKQLKVQVEQRANNILKILDDLAR